MCGAVASTEYRTGGAAIGGRYVQRARSTKAPSPLCMKSISWCGICSRSWAYCPLLGGGVKIVTSLGINFQEQDDLSDEVRVPPARRLVKINPR
jgi:hypothetical protein